MVCPRCDGQGNIYNAKVVDLGIKIKKYAMNVKLVGVKISLSHSKTLRD
jgi:hypothetical protein